MSDQLPLPTETTLDALVSRNARTRPDDLAYRFIGVPGADEMSLTFGALDARATRIAAGLLSRAAPGDRVMLVADTTPDFVASFLGVLRAGMVAVPTNQPRLGKSIGRFTSIARSCAPRAVLASSGTLARVERVLAAEPPHREVALLDLAAIEQREGRGVSLPAITPETLAILQYTSGSTTTPRGVKILHSNFIANAGCIRDCMGLDDTSESVSWLPLFHDMGLISGLVGPIVFACRSTLIPPNAFLARPAIWLEAISRFRGTVGGAPNFAYDHCCEKIDDETASRLDLRSWNVAFCGAEIVRARTLDRFAARFATSGFSRAALLPVYGLAEATLLVSGGPPQSGPHTVRIERKERPHTEVAGTPAEAGRTTSVVACGVTPGDTQVVIVDPDRCIPLKDGAIGEIWVRGASVSPGYWEPDPDRTFEGRLAGDAATDRRFLRTGDLGFMIEGRVFVTGRRKDVIVLRGVNLHAEDIEDVVACVDPELRGADAAAFAFERDGEEHLGVIVEGRQGGARDWPALVARVREELARQFGATADLMAIVRAGMLPKTSSGKIRRRAAREKLFAGEMRVLSLHEDPRDP